MNDSLAFGDRLRYLRWLLAHSDKIPALLAHFDDFQAADTLAGKWDAIKRIGDVVVEISDTFPLESAVFAVEGDSEAAVQALASQLGIRDIDWAKLVDVAATLLPIVFEFVLRFRS